MRYINLPGTALRPSVLCMGGGQLCLEDDDRNVWSLLDTYFELGGNIIDSANIYGKWLPSGKNVCDINIGRWLRRTGVRDQVIVAAKAAHPPLGDMTRSRLKRAELEADLDESLSALDCGIIDLFYLHRDDPAVPVEGIVDDLNDFVSQGKIRYFAASNWSPARIATAQDYAKKSGKAGFAANQLMFSLAIPIKEHAPYPFIEVMDDEAMRCHRQSGLPAVAYESQARGFFHKYAQTGGIPDALQQVYGDHRNTERFDRARRLAQELGRKIGDVILGYVLNQPFPSIAIIGGHTPEQLRDSATAADLILTPEQIRWLAEG